MERPAPSDRQPVGEFELPTSPDAPRPRDWVDELIAMTRPGIDMELPDRAVLSRSAPFVFDDFD